MKVKTIILVSGLSGAGKSSAMNVLEDLGFRCIDNLPYALIDEFLTWVENGADETYENLAIAITMDDFVDIFLWLRKQGYNTQGIFLEASDEVLTNRYQFTRRKHPLVARKKANTVKEAIKIERSKIKLTEEDVKIIDTSNISAKYLKQIISDVSGIGNNSFTISFVSFGFKHGVPLDVDSIYDVRFLNNPFWVEELRVQNGNDQAVYDFVMSDPRALKTIDSMKSYLDLAFKEFAKEGKSHMSVGIGCTGGKHRSVTITNYLYEYYQAKYNCLKFHRDFERE
ncbi:MAG: RNase adapter RapZ [Erysipelotrichaceae bacterium]